jgi:hypothetical protein
MISYPTRERIAVFLETVVDNDQKVELNNKAICN